VNEAQRSQQRIEQDSRKKKGTKYKNVLEANTELPSDYNKDRTVEQKAEYMRKMTPPRKPNQKKFFKF